MFLDRGQQELTGRWFTGGYSEIGMDVTMTRLGSDPAIAGVDTASLAAGGNARGFDIRMQPVRESVEAGAVDFGRGVAVKRVVKAAPDRVKVEVEVAKDAAAGISFAMW